jgi:rsbT co-antagonist protein RsbR
MREIGLSPSSLERRKKYVGLAGDDLARIERIRAVILDGAEELTASFFQFLASIEEARSFLGNRELIQRARELKLEHLRAMAGGEYGPEYAEQRVRLGLVYSRAGLDTRVFLGAFQNLLREIGRRVVATFDDPVEAFEHFASLQKVATFDVGVILDVLVFERERVIRQQQEAIRELSTPVLQIRDRLLLLPIIGVIDTHRAQQITENLLHAIRTHRARSVVMDVTGVATIDSKVANHLLQTVTAARLMGATVIVTGVSSEVAQSLVALGIELAKIHTVGDLQGGLEEAEHLLGLRVAQVEATALGGT